MDVRHRSAEYAIARAANNNIGYNESDYPYNQWWRIHSNGFPQPDCGSFGAWNDHDALKDAGIDIGYVYYEPTGSYQPTDCGIMKYYDKLPYADYRNEVGDKLVSNGHTVEIVTIKEENGLGYDEICHAASDYDGKPGDSSGREVRREALYDGGWNWILRIKDQYNKEIDQKQDEEETEGEFDLSTLWNVKKPGTGCEGLTMTIQATLNAKNKAGLEIDGIYGDLTEQAVKDWQTKYPACGDADGWVGPMTWKDMITRKV